MKRKDEALRKFSCGFNCSQVVFSAFSQELGLDEETALKISTGFGGGISKGEVCGAVSGAIMAIGLSNGHSIEGDHLSKSESHALTKEFLEKFEDKNGSIICKQLLGYDLSDQEEYEVIKAKRLFETKCPSYIDDAIEILEKMFIDKVIHT